MFGISVNVPLRRPVNFEESNFFVRPLMATGTGVHLRAAEVNLARVSALPRAA
jgi:hypothetical protein